MFLVRGVVEMRFVGFNVVKVQWPMMIIHEQDREGFVILSANEGSHPLGNEIIR